MSTCTPRLTEEERERLQKERVYDDMKLHEIKKVPTERNFNMHVIRVKTGWLYRTVNANGDTSMVFVPEHL